MESSLEKELFLSRDKNKRLAGQTGKNDCENSMGLQRVIIYGPQSSTCFGWDGCPILSGRLTLDQSNNITSFELGFSLHPASLCFQIVPQRVSLVGLVSA